MTEKEIRLFNMICENDNPEQALSTAIEVILSYLTHLEPSELTPFVDSPVFA